MRKTRFTEFQIVKILKAAEGGRDCLGQWPDRGRGLTALQRSIVNEAADCGMAVGVASLLREFRLVPAFCPALLAKRSASCSPNA